MQKIIRQHELFFYNLMKEKGWYTTQEADQMQLASAKQKFQACNQ